MNSRPNYSKIRFNRLTRSRRALLSLNPKSQMSSLSWRRIKSVWSKKLPLVNRVLQMSLMRTLWLSMTPSVKKLSQNCLSSRLRWCLNWRRWKIKLNGSRAQSAKMRGIRLRSRTSSRLLKTYSWKRFRSSRTLRFLSKTKSRNRSKLWKQKTLNRKRLLMVASLTTRWLASKHSSRIWHLIWRISSRRCRKAFQSSNVSTNSNSWTSWLLTLLNETNEWNRFYSQKVPELLHIEL